MDSATRRARSSETLDKIVRGADRARRTVGVGTVVSDHRLRRADARQVQKRLGGLSPAGAAQASRLRAPARQPQVRARGDRESAPLSSSQAVTARPRPGDELELTVDSLAFGGAGVARSDGYVVFVAGAIPGDRVRARIHKSKRAYAEARAVEILEPSPDRIEPVADHPGAPWQVLPYDRQLEVKQEQVADALTRIGRLEGFELEPIVPAVEQWRYRNKLEYSFGAGSERPAHVRLSRARAAGTRSSR